MKLKLARSSTVVLTNIMTGVCAPGFNLSVFLAAQTDRCLYAQQVAASGVAQ
jgi:hypothetical protein